MDCPFCGDLRTGGGMIADPTPALLCERHRQVMAGVDEYRRNHPLDTCYEGCGCMTPEELDAALAEREG